MERGELIEAESALREARQQLGEMFGSGGLGTAYVAAYLSRVLTERGDPAESMSFPMGCRYRRRSRLPDDPCGRRRDELFA